MFDKFVNKFIVLKDYIIEFPVKHFTCKQEKINLTTALSLNIKTVVLKEKLLSSSGTTTTRSPNCRLPHW